MKKSLLFMSLVSIGLITFAQNRTTTPVKVFQPKNAKAFPAPKKNFNGSEISAFTQATQQPIPAMKHLPTVSSSTTVIGSTTYNLATNSSVRNAYVRASDGTKSAVFTYSNQASAFSDRGTGYNYSTGAVAWGPAPTARVETSRTGWPSICVFSDGSEMGVSHNTALGQCFLFRRPAKGTGAWTENGDSISATCSLPTYWPRLVSGGANGMTAHVIGVINGTCDGQDYSLRYSRSTDGGLNWDKVNFQIAGTDSTFYDGMGGDDYAIDASGNTVAIVCGDSYFDVMLLKSTDNGTTWTKTVVEQFPIPFFVSADTISDVNGDGTPDTINACDGSVEVLLDQNGKAHVWYGRTRIIDDTPGDGTWSYFPATNGLMYWSEGMSAPVAISGMLDLNSNGQLDFDTTCAGTNPFGVYGGSLSNQPSAGIDALNAIYVSYSAVKEGTNNGSCKSYRHQYLMRSEDNGATWTTPYDIYDDDLTECVGGSLQRDVQNPEGPCVVYYQDDAPGFGIGSGGEDDAANNGKSHDIVEICAAEVLGIFENQNSSIQTVLYPNPAQNNATLEIKSADYAKSSVVIYSAMGQKVKEVSRQLSAGRNIIHLDLTGLSTGLYSVTVVSGNSVTATNLVVE